MRKQYKYVEGAKARKDFEDAMRYAFSIPKEQALPRPKPKRRRKSGKDEG
jgi:hypothetical protein